MSLFFLTPRACFTNILHWLLNVVECMFLSETGLYSPTSSPVLSDFDMTIKTIFIKLGSVLFLFPGGVCVRWGVLFCENFEELLCKIILIPPFKICDYRIGLFKFIHIFLGQFYVVKFSGNSSILSCFKCIS